MENLKIRVANATESKEAQELFFELGYGWRGVDPRNSIFIPKKLKEYFIVNYEKTMDMQISGVFDNSETLRTHKEITLPQLRDLVVLKRNDVNDKNAEDDTFHDLYKTSDGVIYFYHHHKQKWMRSHINEKTEYLHLVKPIGDKQMTSHNIEQQALKSNPKLFLDPTQNYAEIECDGSFMKQDHWIEVPEGVNYLYKDNEHENTVFTVLEMGYRDSSIVWQRTQDEPFLTPESVAHGGKPLDVQVGGNHYKNMKIQPVEFALANGLDFCQGSAIKYILRHAEKGGKQDLQKAKHFIDLMIQHYYG